MAQKTAQLESKAEETETDEGQENLTDEERAALDTRDEATGDVKAEEEDGEKDGEPKADAKDNDDGDAGSDDDDDDDDGEEAQDVPKEPAKGAPPPPMYNFQLSAGNAERDYANELDGLKTEKRDLQKQYDDGDLDDNDLRAKVDALDEKREAIIEDRAQAKVMASMSQQLADQTWAQNIKAFLRYPENEILVGSADHKALWETMMQQVVNESVAAGETLDDWEILTKGRDRLFNTLGLSASSDPKTTPQDQRPPKPNGKKPPMDKVPQTPGRAPAAAAGSARTNADEISGIDDIQDIEERMAGMTDAQRDQVLRQTPGAFADD